MSISFRFATEHDTSAVFKILKDFFGPTYYGADPRYFAWQYRDCPFKHFAAEKDEYCTLLAEEDNQILAMDSFLPWPTIIKGKTARTFWDIEWLSTGIKRGIGRELVAEIRSRCDVYCGYGMNSLSWAAYEKLGYQQRKHIARSVAILDAAACNTLFNPQATLEHRSFFTASEVLPNSAQPHLLKSVSGLSDAYWSSHMARCLGTSYKGPEYLQWRFIDHPFLHYSIVSPDPKGERGLAVVRVEKVKNSTTRILRILDMLPVTGYEDVLTDTVLQFGLSHGAILADFFCASETYATQVCPAPFIPLNDHLPFDIPMLFQPIEWRERKSINMVLDVNPEFAELTFDTMYCTKADGDQDVFLNPDYETILI